MRNRIIRRDQGLVLAIIALGTAFTTQAQTYTYSTLYSFKNNGKDPASPQSYLTVDAAGNLYGTSANGGTFGLGTVFRLTNIGALTVLHSFQGFPTDGSVPIANVALDSAGNLYGTTTQGGGQCCGTVFKLSPTGRETDLHDFTGQDGYYAADVTIDSARNIYGTTGYGGLGGVAGIVFKVDSNNTFSVLYQFCSVSSCADGAYPAGSIVRDSAGSLYGATIFGGSSFSDCGTVFKVTAEGQETVLYTFADAGDGCGPQSGVIKDSVGNLYGVSTFGGRFFGTLFTVPEAGGVETTLYAFCSVPNCTDGRQPVGRVQMDESGNLFGVTRETATTGSGGVVWEVDKAGKETVLFTFGKKVEVLGGLTIDAAGNLYGATLNGGPAHLGSIFKLTLVK